MNRESSRSHSILTLYLRCTRRLEGLEDVTEARLNLVDLAGSERQQLTGSTGLRLKEAGNINKSLLALSSVINALCEQAQGRTKHAPYRDSKLTFLLKDSLGGNSKTCIVACITPNATCLGETISTLRFAQRAKQIRNRAVANKEMHGNIAQLQAEIRRLQSRLAEGADGGTVKLLISRQAEQATQIAALQSQLGLLEESIRRKDQQVSAERMLVKLRDATIKSLQAGQPVGDSQQEITELRRLVDHHPEVTRFAHENLQLRERLRRLENLEERSVKAMELESRLDALCQRIVGADREDDQTRRCLEEAKIEMESLRLQLRQVSELVQQKESEATSQRAHLENQLRALQSELTHFKQLADRLTREKDAVSHQLSNLQQSYERQQVDHAVDKERLCQEKSELSQKLREAQDALLQVQHQVHHLEQQLRDAHVKCNELNAALISLQQEGEQVRLQLHHREQELSQVKHDSQHQQEQLESSVSQLNELGKQHSLLQRQFESQQREAETIRSRLEVQLASLRQQLATALSNATPAPAVPAPDNEARLALSMATHELELARAKIREMERAVEQAKVTGLREGIQQEMNRAQEPVSSPVSVKRPPPAASPRTNVRSSVTASPATAQKNQRLDFLLQSAREDNEELLAQLEEAKKRHDCDEATIEQLRTALAQQQANIESAHQELEHLRQENERLLQHHNLKQKVQYHLRIKHENNDLKEQLQRVQEAYLRLVGEVRQMIQSEFPQHLHDRLLGLLPSSS